MRSKEMPYVLFVAELIYLKICEIKKKNLGFSNIDAVENFIGSKTYMKISSGKFHDEWFEQLEKNHFTDQVTKKKIPEETINLLRVQKDMMVKQLIQEELDMVVAIRSDSTNRFGHDFGNRSFTRLYNWLFKSNSQDLLSG